MGVLRLIMVMDDNDRNIHHGITQQKHKYPSGVFGRSALQLNKCQKSNIGP